VYHQYRTFKKRGLQGLFVLPFSDATSGKESYIGGRYIDLRVQMEIHNH
jgi:uncharacterized protein (DUF1684 family)